MKQLNLEENDDEEPSAAFMDINDQSPDLEGGEDKSIV
jgi:hypothetical protein